jgi:predicted dehydrogenase
MGKLAWGIVSTGNIAHAFARGVLRSHRGVLAAVASRSAEAASAFAAHHGIRRWHGSYEALFADPAVEAVYIATPHPLHAEWVRLAAAAGKHILCEKPLALNAAEAETMIAAAREHDVFLMEAFMYRCHPQTRRLVELIRGGAVGAVKVIDATFSFQMPFDPKSRVYDNALAGGGIMDVGCYCTSMARLVAGAAQGQPFLDPIAVHGVGHVGASRVDEYAVGILSFPGDIVANIATGISLRQENVVRIYGTEGELFVPSPWLCSGIEPGTAHLRLTRYGEDTEDIAIPIADGLYAIEADTVAAHIPDRQAPAMPWADTLGNMRTLDRWRAAVGVSYPGD